MLHHIEVVFAELARGPRSVSPGHELLAAGAVDFAVGSVKQRQASKSGFVTLHRENPAKDK
jgi:hypothetical protein